VSQRFDGSVGPKIGVFADCTDYSIPIVDLARAVEERGFTGIFLNEHPHLPVHAPRSQYPGGGETPMRYSHFWDPYVALSFVAASTELDIGTCISLVGEHDPIALAKAVATLDSLSGGRLTLGVGFGWHREEFEDHGHPATVRAKVVEEHVRLMRALWTNDVAGFKGEFVRVSPSWSWPKPAQKPHPPVLLGVRGGQRNFDRMAAWADGWVPMGTPAFRNGVFAGQVAELRAAFDRAGRDPASVRLTVILSRVSPQRLPDLAEQAHTLGAERVLVKVGDGGYEELKALDLAAESLSRRFGV